MPRQTLGRTHQQTFPIRARLQCDGLHLCSECGSLGYSGSKASRCGLQPAQCRLENGGCSRCTVHVETTISSSWRWCHEISSLAGLPGAPPRLLPAATSRQGLAQAFSPNRPPFPAATWLLPLSVTMPTELPSTREQQGLATKGGGPLTCVPLASHITHLENQARPGQSVFVGALCHTLGGGRFYLSPPSLCVLSDMCSGAERQSSLSLRTCSVPGPCRCSACKA